MKKYIFFLLPFLISCSSKVTEKKNPDLQYNLETINVKGRVKKITEFDYKQFVKDSLINFYISNYDFEFDKYGNIILEKTKSIFQDSTLKKYIYDNMGNKIEVLKNEFNQKDFITQAKYTLNSKGQIISEKQLMFGSPKYTIVEFEYDEFGNKIAAIDAFTGNRYTTNYINTYNQSNELIKTQELVKPTVIRTIDEYKYYKNKIIEKKSTNLLAYIMDLEKYKYDDTGHLISSIYEKNGLFIDEENCKYDRYGNIIEKTVSVKGKINYMNSHFYKYTYDKMHNWVYKETYFLDSTLVRTIKRKIEYFQNL